MFFHIDESGNTGNNLFDKQQPRLSYGVLSSKLNIDVLGEADHLNEIRRLGVSSLHAKELHFEGMADIAPYLTSVRSRFDFRLDYYFIEKPDFAVVTFFNAVFDQGINPAVPWAWYWTPLRFLLIDALSQVMDEPALVESWRLCSIPNERKEEAAGGIRNLLLAVLGRLEAMVAIDRRAREILTDGLLYGASHPLEMDFGIYSPTALSPNTIGFQFVLHAMATRQRRSKQKVRRITVDEQNQFNAAQVDTHQVQGAISSALRASPDKHRYLNHPFLEGAREDAVTLMSHFPSEGITIAGSEDSIGLQIVDCYLWLVSRAYSGKDVPKQLVPLVASLLRTGLIDGISLDGMRHRFLSFVKDLPPSSSISEELASQLREGVESHRAKVADMGLKKGDS